MDVVTQRITTLLGENGRSTLLRIVEKELATEAHDPRPEIRRLGARLDEITTKIDSVIDLAASSPEHKDLMQERLGRLRTEKREIEDRLREIDPAPARITDPEAVVDTILEGLADASQLFESGTMEERKRVVRAFVETLTLDGQNQTGILRIKKLPMPQNGTGNSSFKSLAGVGFEPTTFGL